MVGDDALTNLPPTSGEETGLIPLRGEEIGRIPLHFFWVCETSAGMGKHGRCDALNAAIENTLQQLRQHAGLNSSADVLVRALTFSDGARWHIESPTPLERLHWSPLSGDGCVDFGKACEELSRVFETNLFHKRMYPPYVVLTSLRHPTDNWQIPLSRFLSQPWARKSSRMSFALSEDAPADLLQSFSADHSTSPLSSVPPLRLASPEELCEQMPRVIVEHVSRFFPGPAFAGVRRA